MADFQPTARVIADSISLCGDRLTTVEVHLHRFVLAELNTHRVFSRNSASSRAIPVHRTIAVLADTPVYPLVWATEQRGMQGGPELDPDTVRAARAVWDAARDNAVDAAHRLLDLGVHKSIVNRLLEPFTAHTVLISATRWDGFFRQRISTLAQPELDRAARAIRRAIFDSEPAMVTYGGWHLPYISDSDRAEYGTEDLRRISAARCARVSYLTHDGHHDPRADLALYERLVAADPPHASPLEHVATSAYPDQPWWGIPGNFDGWEQLRHHVLGLS